MHISVAGIRRVDFKPQRPLGLHQAPAGKAAADGIGQSAVIQQGWPKAQTGSGALNKAHFGDSAG
jgi:hypothetical protein